MNPSVIIADEPTNNLDEKNVEILLEIFNKIKRDFRMTIIVASHDKRVIEISDRLFEIKDKQAREIK